MCVKAENRMVTVLGGLLAGFKLIDSPVVRFVMFPHRVEVALCYK